MRWAAVVALVAVVSTACTQGSDVTTTSVEPPTSTTVKLELAAPQFTTAACEESVVVDEVPDWAEDAGLPGVSKYVVSEGGDLIGVIFPEALRAGEPDPEGPSPKILWISRVPRNGSDLELLGAPAGQTEPAVDISQPANSGPGEIYPMIVVVPVPGCWIFTARWNGNIDHVAVGYSEAA